MRYRGSTNEKWTPQAILAFSVLIRHFLNRGGCHGLVVASVVLAPRIHKQDKSGGTAASKPPVTPRGVERRLVPSSLPQLLGEINDTLVQATPPHFLAAAGDKVFFSENDGFHGSQLWVSDGTSQGTTMLSDYSFHNGRYSGSFGPQFFANLNGTVFFSASDFVHGTQLWESNGTTAGTTMVTDINPNGYFSPSAITNFNGTLFFDADDGVHGGALWRSDGTTAGTTMVADINPGSNGSSP